MISPDTQFVIGFGAGSVIFGWIGVAVGQSRGYRKAREWYRDLDSEPGLAIDLFPSTGVGSAQPQPGGQHGEG